MSLGDLSAWVTDNKLLSGVAAVILSGFGWAVKKFFGGDGSNKPVTQSQSQTVNVYGAPASGLTEEERKCRSKATARILFVDDDTSFKVVKIMKGAGIPNVRIVKDVKDLDAAEIADTDIFFVDIQGVGRALEFADEGLGLALAIKEKYPEKKVVIYSAQTDGNRFHKALNKADAALSKNAEPYQFVALVEELCA